MVLDEFSLKAKIAIVTGAATGLGEAITLGLAEAGATMALVSRESSLDAIAGCVAVFGPDSLCIYEDLSLADGRRRVIAKVLDRYQRIDILVNNAGTTVRKPAEEFRSEEWTEIMEVNLNAVFHLCQLGGRAMLAEGSGKIINVASLMSFQGGIGVAPYTASKGGVAQLTKALANEWANRGVNVNALVPGYFRTPMGEPLYSDPIRMQQILSRIPAGKLGEPSQLKGAAVFLASEASDYMHGHLLVVDGWSDNKAVWTGK